MASAYSFDEQSIRRLIRSVLVTERRDRSRPVRGKRPRSYPPGGAGGFDTIALTPASGIPARVGLTPGKATCAIYRIDDDIDLLVSESEDSDVYNTSLTAASGDRYAPVHLTRGGVYVLWCPECGELPPSSCVEQCNEGTLQATVSGVSNTECSDCTEINKSHLIPWNFAGSADCEWSNFNSLYFICASRGTYFVSVAFELTPVSGSLGPPWIARGFVGVSEGSLAEWTTVAWSREIDQRCDALNITFSPADIENIAIVGQKLCHFDNASLHITNAP